MTETQLYVASDKPEAHTRLWLPDMSLDHSYPEPDAHALLHYWQQAHPSDDYASVPDILSVIRIPDETPAIVASIDLCEVVRGTFYAVADVFGKPLDSMVHAYSDYGRNFDIDSALIVPIVQTLMNHGAVAAETNLTTIVEIIRSWKRLGAYCVANTSTLPGCEFATIDFLETHMSGIFDGIVFPRNASGTGTITKGHALAGVIQAIAPSPHAVRAAIHIDDAPHHNVHIHEHVGRVINQHTIRTYMPVYPNSSVPEGTNRADSPLHAFQLANQYMQHLHLIAPQAPAAMH